MKTPTVFFYSGSLLAAVLFLSCSGTGDIPDATGTFEATEVIVSAETTGKLIKLDVEEGQQLKEGEIVGCIDTTQLHLRRVQLEYAVSAVLARRPDSQAQLAAITTQLETARYEKQRIENLLKADAATPKQLDDVTAQISLLEKQYAATQSNLLVTNRSLQSETLPLRAQLDQTADLIRKSVVINPKEGTVLTQFTLENEVVSAGKPIYKLADLNELRLRAYITNSQLSQIKLGQKVTVKVDSGDDNYRTYTGTVSWIAAQAEFTPKTIQTKDERANLVYPIKVAVTNDGFIKAGMYGEIAFEMPK